jgi:hypothetical protein
VVIVFTLSVQVPKVVSVFAVYLMPFMYGVTVSFALFRTMAIWSHLSHPGVAAYGSVVTESSVYASDPDLLLFPNLTIRTRVVSAAISKFVPLIPFGVPSTYPSDLAKYVEGTTSLALLTLTHISSVH